MPMRLDEGWNQIQFNLADFTKRAYGTNYVETLRIQVTSNVIRLHIVLKVIGLEHPDPFVHCSIVIYIKDYRKE